MPKMDWEDFQRAHHRPHVLVVSVEPMKSPEPLAVEADLERLAMRLGAVGNYAIKTEGATIFAAFEYSGDVERFARVFRPKPATRELEWASKTLARMDGATFRRIDGILRGVRLTTKRRRFSPR
jgi:hypothetical protein